MLKWNAGRLVRLSKQIPFYQKMFLLKAMIAHELVKVYWAY